MNQDYIAKNLCVNKDKPEMECNGQCHLAEIMDEADPQESDEPLFSFSEVIQGLFYLQAAFLIIENNFYGYSSNFIAYIYFIFNYTFQWHFNIFHPPTASF